MNNFLVILLSAGGAAFLTAVIAGIRSLSASRLESEAALIRRLNDDAVQGRKDANEQRERAERAERYAEVMRLERIDALDRAARYRRQLIAAGVNVDDEEHNDDKESV